MPAQYAQDAAMPEGIDMGIAYDVKLKARRYYKKGVRENEHKQLLELAVVKNDDGTIAGRIASDMSGGVVVSDDERQEQWHIPTKEIWDAYIAMRSAAKEE